MYNPAIHKRRSIRLKNYDYSSEGLYFITLCSADRNNIFGEIVDGEMYQNTFGKIADEEWIKTSEIRNNISLGDFIIMPNHIHGIIRIDFSMNTNGKEKIGKFNSPSQSIGAIIRGYKGATTKRINNLIRKISTGELQFAPTKKSIIHSQFAPTIPNFLSGEGSIWQRNYYEHIIKTEKAYENISNYILSNPSNWDKDKLK